MMPNGKEHFSSIKLLDFCNLRHFDPSLLVKPCLIFYSQNYFILVSSYVSSYFFLNLIFFLTSLINLSWDFSEFNSLVPMCSHPFKYYLCAQFISPAQSSHQSFMTNTPYKCLNQTYLKQKSIPPLISLLILRCFSINRNWELS